MSVIDQKRIAKNTLLLYVRMGVIMLISLYTSRVVLEALGEVDFGLYSAVGGIVVAFSFLNGVMSSACNRYFAIEIGRNDYKALHKVFCLNVTIFLAIGLLILLLAETVGLWFLNHKMQIPPDRFMASQWVYQFSIISFILTMIGTPYRAIIIAKEKMKVFAYSSIVEAVLKLVIVFLLVSAPIDRLVYYALLMLLVTASISFFYIAYCSHFYAECRYKFLWDKTLFKEIVGYTGWNVFGAMAGIGKTQGINILLNMFFGPAINAAYKVASQVYLSINQFVTNFCTAFNPQIIKSYSAGERQAMNKLVFQSSKFSYFLLFVIILPVFLETPMILDIWLKKANVPDHSIAFCRLMLIAGVLDSISYPFMTAVQATGNVKWYQIVVGSTLFLCVPISYFLLKFLSVPSETVFITIIFTSIVALILRIYFMRRQLQIDVTAFFRDVLWPIVIVTILSPILPIVLQQALPDGLWKCLIVCAISILSASILTFTFGMTKTERKHIIQLVKQKIQHEA